MKVGIDISSIPYQRGVSRYTSNLVSALNKQKGIELSLYGYSLRQFDELKKIATSFESRNTSYEISHLPQSLISAMWNMGFNKVRKQLPNIDIFHSWDWMQPPDKDLPLVSTIHDLAILKFPETAHPKILKMHQRAWKILKERDAEIIAVSQATKKDIIELLDFPANKITVVHEALPEETVKISRSLSEEKHEHIKKKLNLEKPFLLFVGTTEPRKNLNRLIKAWEPLAKDYELIIAGEIGWGVANNKQPTANSQQLRFLGKVTDEELTVLYAEAEVFCYPSLYEGFGLPILEAFYHGTPVLTSNLSSMPEVAGNAAELIDPNSVESIRKGIKKLLNEDKKDQQKRLQKMLIRLHQFSWDKAAKETIRVYQKAIEL